MITATSFEHDHGSYVDAFSTLPQQETKILSFGSFFDQARARLMEAGNLQLLSPSDQLRDNAGKILPCNYMIETADVHLAAQIAKELNMGIVMIGALTSATNNFPAPNPNHGFRGILAIKPRGITSEDELHSTPSEEYIPNKSNQLSINRDKMTVTVGAGLSFGQVNKILASELGPEYFVPVDLTTVDQAFAGAVFATGAMGPSRIRIHEITERVNITNGTEVKSLTDDDVEKHEGLIGLDGGITEMELRILKKPAHRFGLSIALKNTLETAWTEKAAALLTALRAATNLHLGQSTLSSDWNKGFIDGLEIITKEDLELIIQTSASPEMRNEAARLTKELAAANSNYMIYLTANATENISKLSTDNSPNNPLNILMGLINEDIIGEPTAYEGHHHLETMRQLRETIPDLARDQSRIKAKTTELSFSTSTDVNICINAEALPHLNPEEISAIFNTMLRPYYEYEQQIAALKTAATTKGVTIEMHRYGHLQPRSMDPHTRVTAKSTPENEANFNEITNQIKALKEALNTALLQLPAIDPRIQTLHGEKGKISNLKFLTPTVSQTTQQIIQNSDHHWNFRSPSQLKTSLAAAA